MAMFFDETGHVQIRRMQRRGHVSCHDEHSDGRVVLFGVRGIVSFYVYSMCLYLSRFLCVPHSHITAPNFDVTVNLP